MKFLPCVLLLVLGLISGCHSGFKGDAALGKKETIRLSGDYSDDQISHAIKSALRGRHWMIVSEKGNVILARLDHRGIDAELEFVYDESEIVITSNSYTDVDNKGRPSAGGTPISGAIGKSSKMGDNTPYYSARWIANLVKDIRRKLP